MRWYCQLTLDSVERKELANYISQLGLMDRIYLLSGDSHMIAFDDGTNNNYHDGSEKGFPVFQAAPIRNFFSPARFSIFHFMWKIDY